MLSSQDRRWNGVVVELHHFREVDVVVPVREHIVGVHLAGAVSLTQSRYGRTCIRHVRGGDVTFTPIGEPKRFQHAGENVVLLLRLAPALVQSIAGDEYALDPSRLELRENPGAPDPHIVALGKQLLACLEAEGAPARLQVDALAIDLTLHLLCQYATTRMPAGNPAPRLPQRKLQRAIAFIDAHLRDDLALADIARVLAISPGHFSHAFKQTTGLSPHRFVLERRVENAKAMLLETDLPITEIADRIGCATPSHFSVMFHRVTGQTPRDFRNHG